MRTYEHTIVDIILQYLIHNEGYNFKDSNEFQNFFKFLKQK